MYSLASKKSSSSGEHPSCSRGGVTKGSATGRCAAVCVEENFSSDFSVLSGRSSKRRSAAWVSFTMPERIHFLIFSERSMRMRSVESCCCFACACNLSSIICNLASIARESFLSMASDSEERRDSTLRSSSRSLRWEGSSLSRLPVSNAMVAF